MERLTEISSLRVVESSTLHKVEPTEIGIRERYRALVNPSTSVESSKDTFSFNILPTLGSELDVRDCFLCFEAKITKNGGPYSATDQVSSVNSLGVLAWEHVKTFIGE